MRNFLILLIVAAAFYGYYEKSSPTQSIDQTSSAVNQQIYNAYKHHQSDVQVLGIGTVSRILSDDLEGSQHQRFILRLDSGHTILIAHNIDLAPKIYTLNQGDTVEFYGEYKYNNKGGVVHWTHHDPSNRHEHGWLLHRGKRYE